MNGQGSMCNQAIMLITDGAMEDFESVFEEFNWPDRRVRTRTAGTYGVTAAALLSLCVYTDQT